MRSGRCCPTFFPSNTPKHAHPLGIIGHYCSKKPPRRFLNHALCKFEGSITFNLPFFGQWIFCSAFLFLFNSLHPFTDCTATWRKTPKGRGTIHPYHYASSNRVNGHCHILLACYLRIYSF
ncbi:hypothetical protein HanHA300_Chr04g0126211 [Helianthus annuus]|nr:hypothetical protein HanHA300_Chr04g0126211 [Helianthus annuus]KAJ0596118.1 hypothetical protein HanHA89_Chr04g0139131 [Helianthus annuus]KAJ0756769.1 hypothetical protein HanLR1_Chr04g0130881 [Helianthus annuus]KAJ0760517.1 hypothetical protein HanOQP8_Chr04g0138901 [Helianthus annuus]